MHSRILFKHVVDYIDAEQFVGFLTGEHENVDFEELDIKRSELDSIYRELDNVKITREVIEALGNIRRDLQNILPLHETLDDRKAKNALLAIKAVAMLDGRAYTNHRGLCCITSIFVGVKLNR